VTSTRQRYQRIAPLYDLLDLPFESLSGHIPRSLLRASDLMPFCHQYPAACCGDFY
jgi:hypothetical protein